MKNTNRLSKLSSKWITKNGTAKITVIEDSSSKNTYISSEAAGNHTTGCTALG